METRGGSNWAPHQNALQGVQHQFLFYILKGLWKAKIQNTHWSQFWENQNCTKEQLEPFSVDLKKMEDDLKKMEDALKKKNGKLELRTEKNRRRHNFLFILNGRQPQIK